MSEGSTGGQGAEPGRGAARPCPALQTPVRAPSSSCWLIPGSWAGWSAPHKTRAAEGDKVRLSQSGCSIFAQNLVETNWEMDICCDKPWGNMTMSERWIEHSIQEAFGQRCQTWLNDSLFFTSETVFTLILNILLERNLNLSFQTPRAFAFLEIKLHLCLTRISRMSWDKR